MRRFVIGDVHGCSKALRTIIEKISPNHEDQLIFLGDLIDRGPDSRGVIDLMLKLSRSTRVVCLRGNHEVMLLGVLLGGCDPTIWLQSGGAATVASYGGSLERIPPAHLAFFRSMRAHYETETEAFIHAGYEADVPIEKTDDSNRYWNHLEEVPVPHISGKRVYVGHSPQAGGEIRDAGHVVYVDTYCYGGGWLTALDLDGDEIIQADSHGHLRRNLAAAVWRWLARRKRGSWQKTGSNAAGAVVAKPKLAAEIISDNGTAT